MTQGIETNVGGVWQARQTTAGTIEPSAATGTKRLRKKADDGLRAAKTTAQEEYVDGEAWSNAASYIDTIGGDVGSLPVQGQIGTVAFLWAQLLGVDTVTGSADPYTHTISSSTSVPVSNTIRMKTGSSVGPVRQAWYDAKISRLSQNVGQGQKVMEMVESIMALNAAEYFGTDPVAADSGEDPLSWSECVTRVDGTAFPEISGDTLEGDARVDVYRGQNPKPVCFTFGKGMFNRTVGAIVTDSTLPVIYNGLYGTATPTDGLAVAPTVTYVALETLYTRSVTRTLRITTPRVEIVPGDWVLGPRADGGVREVAFGGRCQRGTSTPIITVVALTGDATAYV